MSYRIGIGLLIDAPFYDKIRSLELEIAEATKNYAGLRQPPHEKVKKFRYYGPQRAFARPANGGLL
jgi:hypothetical protein